MEQPETVYYHRHYIAQFPIVLVEIVFAGMAAYEETEETACLSFVSDTLSDVL